MPEAPIRVRLILLSGARVGEQVEVESSVTLGRLPECDLRIEETGVSRKHARVRVDGPDVWIQDLGSSNGTKIGGRRVQEAKLGDGDVIELGPARLRVVVEGIAPPPPPEPVVNQAVVRTDTAGRGRGGALQYNRVGGRGGLLSDDIGQSAAGKRLLAVVIVIAVAAAVFWLAYTRTN